MLARSVVIGFLAFLTLPANGAERPFVIRSGANEPICQTVDKLLGQLPAQTLLEGSWPNNIDGVPWKTATRPTIVAGGASENVRFKHASVDIDNDGSPDVVVVETNMLRSVLVDSLFVLTPAQFSRAQEEKTLGAILSEAPGLIAGQGMSFSNGGEANPVELQVLVRESTSYVLLREYFFGKRGAKYANSFAVVKLDKSTASRPRPESPRQLSPRLICRFVWR